MSNFARHRAIYWILLCKSSILQTGLLTLGISPHCLCAAQRHGCRCQSSLSRWIALDTRVAEQEYQRHTMAIDGLQVDDGSSLRKPAQGSRDNAHLSIPEPLQYSAHECPRDPHETHAGRTGNETTRLRRQAWAIDSGIVLRIWKTSPRATDIRIQHSIRTTVLVGHLLQLMERGFSPLCSNLGVCCA